jgi:hypothetical protein
VSPTAHPATPPRRRRRTAAATLLALLAALALTGLGTAEPGVAAAPLATISIGSLDPTVGTPGGRLHVTGTVTTGRQRLRDLQVSLRLSRTPVNSRAELAGVAAGATASKDGDVVASQAGPAELGAERSTTFDLGADLDELTQLQQFGVYALAVQVTATHRDGVGTVAITRTFLPWVPTVHDFRPASFSWLWPLVDRPVRLADGTFADDSLTASLADGGRLSRLTAAGAAMAQSGRLTWAVDPDLLDTARAMSKGYTVRGGQDGTIGAGRQLAGQWLDQLRAATATSEVVALPYGDPDLAALRRGGLDGEIALARSTGSRVAADVLGRDVTSDVSWPESGYLDRPTLAVLRRGGVNAVVLDGRAQPTRLELNYTPSGRASARTPAGSMASLVADPGLTDLLRDAPRSPLLAAQRFLAETALITAELPSAGADRTILVAPPQRWNPPPEFLDRLVAAAATAPWMSRTAVSDMRAAPTAEVDRRPVRYPAAARRRELPASYLTALATLRQRSGVFGDVLADRENRDRIVPDLDAARLRLESTWWRDREDRANRLNLEQTYVADLLRSVRVQPGSYTFGSKSGSIPLTIANETDFDVTVRLQLVADPPRLRLTAPSEPITIGPNRKVQENVKASAVASGVVSVKATLYTVGGAQLSPEPVPLRIRITQYGTVALVLTIGAAAVLVLTALVRIARRARAAHRASATPSAGEPGSADVEQPDAPDASEVTEGPDGVIVTPQPTEHAERSP